MTLSDSWDALPSNPNNRRSSVLSSIDFYVLGRKKIIFTGFWSKVLDFFSAIGKFYKIFGTAY